MVTNVEITRKQIIVVDKVGTNQYEDLTWTDKEGKSYKVKSTRKQYFDCIVPDQAVEISFSKYKNTEYPYSATAVADKIEVVKPIHLTKEGGLESAPYEVPVVKIQTDRLSPSDKEIMAKSDWAEKDRVTRKSIERQTALKEATNITCALIAQGKEMSPTKTIDIAKLFEAYLEGNYLVDEAKKLLKGEG